MKKLTSILLSIFLMVPLSAYAFFFYFGPNPFSFLIPNDKKAVEDLEKKQDWPELYKLAEIRYGANEKNPTWLNISGYALMKMNRCDEAMPKFEQTLAMQPDHAAAKGNIELCKAQLAQKSGIEERKEAQASKAEPTGISAKLNELKQLHTDGLISKEVYETRQAEILRSSL